MISMPRIARVVVLGCGYHVTQRGNNRQDVFFVEDDRRAYQALLAREAGRFGLTIQGYRLMTNHVHLVATPQREESLAKSIGRTNCLYAQYVNRLHGRSGHLWQNRFFSCPVDEDHFWTALAYVELNPRRAGLAQKAWEYPWSSAAAPCGRGPAAGLLDMAHWGDHPRWQDWTEALTAGLPDSTVTDLRNYTATGRPLGSDSFIARLECAIGRRLRRLPIGRPKKPKEK
jgi:putative transposase